MKVESGNHLQILCFFSQKLVGVAFIELLHRISSGFQVQLHTGFNELAEVQLEEGNKLVIIDETIKDADISEFVKLIKKKKKDARVLVFGDNCQLAALPLMMCGASGYLEKSSEEFELSRAIEVITNGGTYLPQKLVFQLMEAEKTTKGIRRRLDALTASEKLLIYELSKGGTMRQISQRINKAVTTLSTQKRRVMQKLRVNTTHELMEIIKDFGSQNRA